MLTASIEARARREVGVFAAAVVRLGRLRAASTLAEQLADAALGVSKQEHIVRPAPAVDVFERASPRARKAVEEAALPLLALSRHPDGLAGQILAESGRSCRRAV